MAPPKRPQPSPWIAFTQATLPRVAYSPLPPRKLGTFPTWGRQRSLASPQNQQNPPNKKPSPRTGKGDRVSGGRGPWSCGLIPNSFPLNHQAAYPRARRRWQPKADGRSLFRSAVPAPSGTPEKPRPGPLDAGRTRPWL